ncbi:type VI secretion system protein TssA [Serratia bockelmannii]|uniref:type VI secretion system protein TssA n=1 Tax=Serratia bockelmannii TaxID=2703793 RepID=UPI003FA716B7
MAALQNVLHACGVDEDALLSQARARSADWANWLMPVAADRPTGDDPGYDDDFQRIREEVNKLSGIDTGLICELAEKLLTNVCKDLRVIGFYVWARLHQDGEIGLAQGVELLAAMLERFGNELHPLRARSRQSALTWLASRRVTDSLALYPEVDMSVMQRIMGALLLSEQAFIALDEASRPDLGGLYQALDNRLIQSGGANTLVPQTSREEGAPVTSALSSAPALNAVTSGRDLLDQAKVLAKYLRDQPGGWLAGHHLLKSVRWDTLTELPPLDAAGRTRLAPPKPDNKAHLKRLFLQKSWLELLEHTDTLLAQGVNHLWLDVQWYAWQALAKQDHDSVRADILCRDLKGLLARLPGLEALAFSDGTPFADEVTLNWINESVLDDIAGWKEESVPALLALSLTGCGLTQGVSDGTKSAFTAVFYKKIKVLHLDFTAREALNTDSRESHSLSEPVMVRVYQLKDHKAFDKTVYQQLLKDDERALEADLLATREVVVKPGGDATLDMPMAEEAKYVAVVGLFRHPDTVKNTWRLTLNREELDPDKARVVEAGDNHLTLLPVKDK